MPLGWGATHHCDQCGVEAVRKLGASAGREGGHPAPRRIPQPYLYPCFVWPWWHPVSIVSAGCHCDGRHRHPSGGSAHTDLDDFYLGVVVGLWESQRWHPSAGVRRVALALRTLYIGRGANFASMSQQG